MADPDLLARLAAAGADRCLFTLPDAPAKALPDTPAEALPDTPADALSSPAAQEVVRALDELASLVDHQLPG